MKLKIKIQEKIIINTSPNFYISALYKNIHETNCSGIIFYNLKGIRKEIFKLNQGYYDFNRINWCATIEVV